MDSLKKSFKSHGSYKHTRRLSAGSGVAEEEHHESKPILFDHDNHHHINNQREVVVKIDGNDSASSTRDVELALDPNGNKIWRESSYEFWKDGNVDVGNGIGSNVGNFDFSQKKTVSEDPPSKLIGQFLNKQKTSGVVSLDMDLGMDELQQDRCLPPIAETRFNTPILTSREVRVSFQEPESGRVEIAPDHIERHYKESSEDDDFDSFRKSGNVGSIRRDEVLRCTSNASFRRTSLLSRNKTKSRLMDPPADQYVKSGQRSGLLKSGFMGKGNDDEDEDDPFAIEDLPDHFKKAKLNTLTILQWVSLILILIVFVCTITLPSLEKIRLWGLQLWKWELLILVLICGRLLSGWGIHIAVFFIERNFLLRKRVLYFVYGLRKAVQNCLWLGLVLIAWHFMFDSKVEREVNSKALPYVTKILVCFLVGTLIWLVKTLFVKVLASTFHVSTYFDRIQDSLFNQYVIETLSGPPLIQLQNIREDEEKVMSEVRKLQNAGVNVPNNFKDTAFSTMKSGRVIGSGGLQRKPSMIGKSMRYSGAVSKRQDQGITIDHLHKLNQKNISAWNMKRMMNIVRNGVMSTLDERISDTCEDESAMQIRSEYEAKAAAKKIFNNVAKPRSKFIYLNDLLRFMREDEALKTMSLFEGASEKSGVNKSTLKNWVVNAFRERRALALTLNDTKTAVNRLHHMVNIIVGIIIGIVWLLILEITTSRLIYALGSQALVAVFIFGNTCKTIFEAIIFLFVMHPFDVGDRCEVDGVQMVVEEMNILNTVFLRFDNQKIFYPNSVLATLPISNYYRSPDMGESIEFSIHISTPTEKIATMKQKITAYVESKKEYWYPSPSIVLKDVEDMNRLKWAVWLTHTMNHQNMGERWVRRAQLVEEMIKVFKDLDIEYRMLPVDLNLRNMDPPSTRLPSNWTACA
ncbi:Mechanosensitive ion channel protein [Thalictrum thalictroides]|uniref:Mechanosensitive ion channel protein n=1 Tax=Thalictrum thalictroides TaxID=46969 RepID=A0A7J6V792_THATH|nr:Mechanosensitive ion channel protein [Thalictrum thalictroides]